MSKIEELKMYKEVILDIKRIYDISEENRKYNEAVEYLDKQTNNQFGVFLTDGIDKPKVKRLRIYQ